jgi:hypothetical protein
MQTKSNSSCAPARRHFSKRLIAGRKLANESGFFTPRLLLVVLLSAGAFLIATRTLPAFLRRDRSAKSSERTLSFAERVAYQRVIEDVYWRHRIWPKERPDAKPSLDAVMSQAQVERKTADYLRKSQALEDYWKRPITPEQLQAEMERMVTNTKKPEVLRELFAALGNDAFVVAECLARPALADRLLTNWYSYDQRIHGDLEQRAKSELQAHNTVGQMKQLSGTYTEVEFVKNDNRRAVAPPHHLPNKQSAVNAPAIQRPESIRTVTLSSREWTRMVQKLAVTFSGRATTQPSTNSAVAAGEAFPVGKLSPLQEEAGRWYALAVLEKSDNRLKLATASWSQQPLEPWLAQAEKQLRLVMMIPHARYTLPKVIGVGS